MTPGSSPGAGPAEYIADLNAELADGGEDVRLQRLTLAAGSVQIPFEVVCRAFVRGYEPAELVAGITQQTSKVILSPTEIAQAQWTSGRPGNEDRRVPTKGNRIFIAGRARNVEAATGKYVAGVLVRIELQVAG